jgi:Rad3-related DNA helicase
MAELQEPIQRTLTPAKFDLSKIDQSFPKQEYRDGQKEAIEFALKSFNEGKKIVILECPTGSGKSAIGMTVADMVPASYYITITKILQDQLADDFGGRLITLKGRNAYPCTFYKREGQKLVDRMLWTADKLREAHKSYPTCATGYCRTKENRDQPGASPSYCSRCMPQGGPQGDGKMKGDLDIDQLPYSRYSACPYYEKVFSAINARKVTMNFSSFLYQTCMTKRFDEPRDLMIIDECHNIEPQLLDFVSFSINDLHLQQHGIFIPDLSSPYDYYVWLIDTKVATILAEVVKKARNEDNFKLADDLEYTLKKFQMFIHRIEESDDDRTTEWVSDYEERLNNNGEVQYRSVTIRPVFATAFANKLLFKYADRILLMSATVLDVNVVCRSLGLDKSQIAAKRLRNRFPVKNRPIYLRTVAKMTGGKSAMHKWAPQLVDGVNDIMDKHEGEKGIIHTHNFAIMEYLMNYCNSDAKNRFLCQRDFFNKTKMLEEHGRLDDSVIIAPAMHEGVDLVDDMSRFQIICKVPFANFFDNQQLARRVEIDRRYYIWLTALKLVQMYGRSIRSQDDHAMTYVLDESIYRFLDDAKNMLPIWFKEAIIDEYEY